jgi:hypothetical protein
MVREYSILTIGLKKGKIEMKKIIAMIFSIILILGLSAGFAGCNRQVVDLNYEYNTAVIDMFDGTTKTIKIKKWRDYEGEQIQLTDKNGDVWLVSSINCHLINE